MDDIFLICKLDVIYYSIHKLIFNNNLIDDIVINLWFFENFASMEDIKKKKKSDLMVNLSKFTSNKRILNEVVDIS